VELVNLVSEGVNVPLVLSNGISCSVVVSLLSIIDLAASQFLDEHCSILDIFKLHHPRMSQVD
jgi:hypothetical protein